MEIYAKKMYWERANLHIILSEDIKSAYIFSEHKTFELEFKNNELTLPFYNIPEGSILSAGKYLIKVNELTLKVSKEELKNLDSLTRIHKYKDVCAYTVDLNINDDFELIINTEFYIKDTKPTKEKFVKSKTKLKDKIKMFIKYISYKLMNLVYKIAHIFSGKNNVLIFAENDNELSVNLEPLYKEVKESKKYKVKVLTNNCFKNKVNPLYRLKEIIAIAKARYIVIDNYTPILTYVNLNKRTTLIQLWHAAIGFKSVGYARFGKDGSPHPYVSGHRYLDHVIVDDESLIDVYKEVFGISKEKIHPFGLPRLDNFLEEKQVNESIEKVYESYNFLKDKRVILFAPTYRGKGQKEAYYDMDKINQQELYEYCKNNNFVCVFKFHPFTNNKIEIKDEYKDLLVDVTEYKSINELLYVTDILITDYSSAYEATLLDIPIIFYRYDKEEYEYTRGIHTADVFKGKTIEITTSEELINNINQLKEYKRKDIKYKKRDSIKKIIEEIFGE